MTKQAKFSGSFYSDNADDIKKQINNYSNVLISHLGKNWREKYNTNIKALISPHAGYVYSGFTANMGYLLLDKTKIKRVIVIGPSHKVGFDGVSVLRGYEKYNTPLGALDIDAKYQDVLSKKFLLGFDEKIHQEHSTETQMPFIKYHLDLPIIELIYSKIDYRELAKILEYILFDKDNMLIVSTDLSHFHTKHKAKIKDSNCLNAIENMDLSLYDGCEACGETGIMALIQANKNIKLKSQLLDYRTSSDYSGDESSVVGYLSASFST